MFKISEPCHENWDDMTPTQQGRHCASCEKQVVDFTKMTEHQSEKLLREAAEKSGDCQTGICGRVHADATGALQLGKKRRHRLLTDSMAAMLALSMLSGCQETQELQGEIEGPQGAVGHAVEQAGEAPAQNPDGSKQLMGDICVVMPPEPAVKVEPEPVAMGEICEVPPLQEKEPVDRVIMGKMLKEHMQVRPMPAQIEPLEVDPPTVKGEIHVIRGEIEATDK